MRTNSNIEWSLLRYLSLIVRESNTAIRGSAPLLALIASGSVIWTPYCCVRLDGNSCSALEAYHVLPRDPIERLWFAKVFFEMLRGDLPFVIRLW